MKKRILVLLIAFSLTLGTIACGKRENKTETAAPNTVKQPNPAEDEELNLLMVGNSGCYYFVEELYGMLNAAGIQANICNVYYSGCTLQQHYNWLKTGEANYDYYETNEKGRVGTVGCNLEYCLKQRNWDYISLQEGGNAKLRATPAAAALSQRKDYLDALLGLFSQRFPQAKLLWQENSAFQVGYNGNLFSITNLEEQQQDTKMFREFAQMVADAYQLDWVPRGDAAIIVREGGYDNLCARLGKGNNHEGDYYHDGDVGGGQYLTACVWYEMLTGKSCIGNTYRPVYTYQGQTFQLEEDLITTFQEAAHQAVTNKQ